MASCVGVAFPAIAGAVTTASGSGVFEIFGAEVVRPFTVFLTEFFMTEFMNPIAARAKLFQPAACARPAAIVSISSMRFGIAAVNTSAPVAVISTSSSMRMPRRPR